MPKKGETLEYHPGVISMKAPYIIVADIDSLLRKMDTCANDPSKSSTEKKNKHEMCRYSLFTNCSFNKKIINLIITEVKIHIENKCYICNKPFHQDQKNNYIKVRDHCHYTGKYRGAAHKICNLMYNTPREIPVVFHNGSCYDYHFITKGLAEEFEGDFECLGENKEKYLTFSVPIKKESNEDSTIIYRIKFIDSFRLMATSLSILVDNLSNKLIENGKCVNCKSYLEFIKIKNSCRLIFECFDCKRRYQKDIDDETLKKILKKL